MACCLTALSHYLNQCWLMISVVSWHSPDSNFTENTWDIYRLNEFEIYWFETVVQSPGVQWVNNKTKLLPVCRWMDGLIGWPTGWLIGWFIDWLFKRLIDWLIDWLMDGWMDGLIDGWMGWLTEIFISPTSAEDHWTMLKYWDSPGKHRYLFNKIVLAHIYKQQYYRTWHTWNWKVRMD